MPSTHSATISYYATFITLATSMLPIHSSLYLLPRFIIYPIAPILAISTAATVCISRIRLGHHTIKQVVAGITVGILCGAVWFWWWYKGSAQALAWNLVDILPRSIARLVRWHWNLLPYDLFGASSCLKSLFIETRFVWSRLLQETYDYIERYCLNSSSSF